MTARKLDSGQVGYPVFPLLPPDEGGFFALTSHKRAREALRFGLAMPGIGFNVFVIGEDRSGRMSATMALLETYARDRPPQDDWVYLNNFRHPHRPEPCRLPPGQGRHFRDSMARLAVHLRGATADEAVALVDALAVEFAAHKSLAGWLDSLRTDVLGRHGRFADAARDSLDDPERRYAVNLLIDHGDDHHAGVVLEPNPSYENLFGRIEYVQSAGGLSTDFTMIRAGALHRANGGILVLRAENLSKDNHVWESLKGALRDQMVRIEEMHRTGTVPLASATRPLPVPFEAKVVIVGAPRWYYGWFLNDPEFRVYFKVKADICDDLRAIPENLSAFVGLIQRIARGHDASCDPEAVQRLLGVAARWAEHRAKFSSRLELLDDLIGEAALHARTEAGCVIGREEVALAVAERRRRVAQYEDRLHRTIAEGAVMVSVTGTAIGQVNSLLVMDKVDHRYGCPCRVTARAWVGERGLINIERDVALGGPLQHKGVMGLQGYLAGTFARLAPVSFSCSLTFEQNYQGIEGDSASLAELLAILSDLSGVPLRQDLAVTGSMNQLGEVQPVSGVIHKVEGFYRACRALGELSGSQGVVLPANNLANLVLHDEIADAVAAGTFELWTVTRVEEAVELLTGLPAGEPDGDGRFPAGSVYGRVAARLAQFDQLLAGRDHRQ